MHRSTNMIVVPMCIMSYNLYIYICDTVSYNIVTICKFTSQIPKSLQKLKDNHFKYNPLFQRSSEQFEQFLKEETSCYAISLVKKIELISWDDLY